MLKRELEIVDLDKVLNYCFMKKIVLLLVVLNVCSSFAQDIEVKKFEPLEKDQTAALSPRKDINGVTCGLVKVIFREQGLLFDGNIIGDVTLHPTEYWVYLAKGTKRLNIKHPSYLPTTIVFSDFGISRIESGKVYSLELKSLKREKAKTGKKGTVVIQVIPGDTHLYVDDDYIPKDSTGLYILTMSQGDHFVSVKSGSFAINNKIVKVGKKTNKVTFNLTDYYANLSISCLPADTHLNVNGEFKALGRWEGLVAPGKYIIEAAKDGFIPLVKEIEVNENDSIDLNLSELHAITGGLQINYKPDSCTIYLDGKKIGVTPMAISNIPSGKHELIIDKAYYNSVTKKIIIEEGQNYKMEGHLSFSTEFGEVWVKAHEGNADAQLKLAWLYDDEVFYSSMKGWNPNNADPSKAVDWFEKAALQGHPDALRGLAHHLWTGNGCKKDSRRAFLLFKQSVEIKPDSNVYYWLGTFYRYGLGGLSIDLKEAASFYRKAILNSSTGYDRAAKALKEIGYENEIP